MRQNEKHATLLESFRYATRGLIEAIRSERNVKTHCGFVLLVVIAGAGPYWRGNGSRC